MFYLFISLISFLNLPIEFNFLDDQYSHYEGAGETEGLLGLMTSNNLILVVLGVSLIIWFTLLAFLYKIDRKVSRLEQKQESEIHIH
ncbi:MAG: CcmD family protein [Balneolales bacterium]